jgi:hypothetical protein
MKRNGIISWNADKLKTIKQDLLFFDNLMYEKKIFKIHLEALNIANNKLGQNQLGAYMDELESSITYLKEKKVLDSFNIIKLLDKYNSENNNINKKAYKPVRKIFKNFHEREVLLRMIQNEMSRVSLDIIKDKSENNLIFQDNKKVVKIIKDITNDNLGIGKEHATSFVLRHLSLLLNKIEPDKVFIPNVQKFKSLDKFEESKEEQVIKLVISNIPTPDNLVPFDEILDFREDTNNKRRYMGLTNWIKNISNSSLNIHEIKEELEYYTLDFENHMKLQKSNYQLSNLEVFIFLPLEIAEKTIKLQWSKIPESIFKFKRNKTQLLIEESNAPGREMAYIIKANEKFKK